jgi:hypothetical protein
MKKKKIEETPLVLTWEEIENAYEAKYGKNHHHLTLHCVLCDNSITCRCMQPKVDAYGICSECAAKRET